MIIDDIEVLSYSIPFTKPLLTYKKKYTHREGVWIKVSANGIVGLGEAAPLYGFSIETLKDVNYALEGFCQAVINEEYDSDDIFSLIQIHSYSCPSLRFGLETALFDILSRLSNKNISEYININSKKQIEVNGIHNLNTLTDGCKIIKVKMGYRNLFDEIECMHSLIKTYGENIKFRLDLNGALDLTRSIRYCKEMEQFNIDYIEQPINAQNLEDLAELRYHTSIPIALDESLSDYNSAIEILENQAADVFIIKPMVSGGFLESNKIIDLLIEENKRSVITTSLETSIGHTACLHIALANNISEPCGLATGPLLSRHNFNSKIVNGLVSVPLSMGLGQELGL
mgnify:FL=1